MKADEWKHTLTRIETKLDELHKDIASMKTDLEVHKVKSGFWGALMGAVVAFSSHVFFSKGT